MSFSVFEKIDPSCQNGSMEKAKNIPYHQRPYASIAERTLVDISIYSPRPQIAGTGNSHSKISIHSPHTGRDRLVNAPIVSPSLFQSTLPAWGETILRPVSWSAADISIHSPRMGRDYCEMHVAGVTHKFQSTLPAWGETILDKYEATKSIFQSTLPAWGETVWMRYVRPWLEFQSTLPAWGETQARDRCQAWDAISIHSPRMGRDETISSISPSGWDFNPLSPHGERRLRRMPSTSASDFNPLSPHGERLGLAPTVTAEEMISIHSPRMGRDGKGLRLIQAHD